MRLTAVLAGMASCALLIAANPGHANAEDLNSLISGDSGRINKDLTLLGLSEDQVSKKDQLTAEEIESDVTSEQAGVEEKEEVVEPKRHVIKKNESLTKIAKAYDTTWERIFAKNESIDHPDDVRVGDELTIPTQDEMLEEREVPLPPALSLRDSTPVRSAPQTRSQSTAVASTTPRASSAGNTYYHGYCTWYVKNRRPDLPNNLGNAITWASRAAAQGIAIGTTPRVGAVGQQGNHVVYVESVNGDGTVTVSEMNFKGWNITSSRTVAASSFTYIY